MTHLSESEFVRAADESMARDERAAFDAHLASCPSCRETLEAQVIARRVLVARPIAPVRDLSAALRRTLEAERPWIEQLNWRRLSLRVAPVAAALTLVAFFLVRTPDTPVTIEASGTDQTVASALWSGEVSDDQLLSLFLQARPDEALSTYVKEK